MEGQVSWGQLLFIAGVVGGAVTFGFVCAFWIMSKLQKNKDEAKDAIAEVVEQVGTVEKTISDLAVAHEKVIGALRVAILGDLKETRHTMYGRFDTLINAVSERLDDHEERIRQQDKEQAVLKAQIAHLNAGVKIPQLPHGPGHDH